MEISILNEEQNGALSGVNSLSHPNDSQKVLDKRRHRTSFIFNHQSGPIPFFSILKWAVVCTPQFFRPAASLLE